MRMKRWLKIDDPLAGFAVMGNLTLIFLWGGGVWPPKKCDRHDTARVHVRKVTHRMQCHANSSLQSHWPAFFWCSRLPRSRFLEGEAGLRLTFGVPEMICSIWPNPLPGMEPPHPLPPLPPPRICGSMDCDEQTWPTVSKFEHLWKKARVNIVFLSRASFSRLIVLFLQLDGFFYVPAYCFSILPSS